MYTPYTEDGETKANETMRFFSAVRRCSNPTVRHSTQSVTRASVPPCPPPFFEANRPPLSQSPRPASAVHEIMDKQVMAPA